MIKKTILSLTAADIKINMIKKFYLYIPVALITVFYCISAYNSYSFCCDIGEVSSDMTLGGYLFYLWKGETLFSGAVSGSAVRIPAFVTFFYMYNGFLICRYLSVRRSHSMENFYLRSSNELNWHLSKLIWCIISTLLFYGVFLICTVLSALFSGSISLETTDDIINCLWQSGYPSLPSDAGHLVLMPFLVLISSAFIQAVLSLLLSPIAAYSAVILYYALSLFLCKSCFIYNYAMLLRADVYDSRGVSYNTGIICGAALILSVSVIYVLISKRKKEKFNK